MRYSGSLLIWLAYRPLSICLQNCSNLITAYHRRLSTKFCTRQRNAQVGPPSASAKAQHPQRAAARGRTIQREQDLALRRILVAYVFKQLRPGLQATPSSKGTAQAIISRLKTLPFDRVPPMSVRTIKADIFYMKKNGNFGI
jgi:hypothetical protein